VRAAGERRAQDTEADGGGVCGRRRGAGGDGAAGGPPGGAGAGHPQRQGPHRSQDAAQPCMSCFPSCPKARLSQ